MLIHILRPWGIWEYPYKRIIYRLLIEDNRIDTKKIHGKTFRNNTSSYHAHIILFVSKNTKRKILRCEKCVYYIRAISVSITPRRFGWRLNLFSNLSILQSFTSTTVAQIKHSSPENTQNVTYWPRSWSISVLKLKADAPERKRENFYPEFRKIVVQLSSPSSLPRLQFRTIIEPLFFPYEFFSGESKPLN